jgi:hypothetical protein
MSTAKSGSGSNIKKMFYLGDNKDATVDSHTKHPISEVIDGNSMMNHETMTEGDEEDERNNNIGQEVQGYQEVLSNNYNDDVNEQELVENHYQMDEGCLSSMEGSCDLSNFDHDYFNVEEAVVLMYEKSLNYTHNGNYESGKAPLTVRTECEATNVVLTLRH